MAMTMTYAVDESREHVILEMHDDGRPLAHILFDGATAEAHAANVGKFRAELSDPVAATLDPGSRLEAVPYPTVMAERRPGMDGVVMVVRHPGLGWQGYVLSDEQAAKLARDLVAAGPS